MTKFEEYREQYSEFVYRGYHYTIGADLCGEHPEEKLCRVVYDFETPGLSEFHPTWTFPVRRELDAEAKRILEELIFQLGLAETISYYKINCPKKVRIECGTLTGEQRAWWRKLYYNGLGEFMYRNGIEVSEEELLTIECPSPEEQGVRKPFQDPTEYKGFLVPVGGGKDSVVTLETLRGQDIMTYHINDDSAIDEVIEVFNHTENDCRARRTLDPNMLELNRKGYLNGHTPFSAIVAFSSTAAAFLSGRRMIALSNETSANETTVRGSFVNHQYSKSYEFEQDFQNYIGQITTSDIHYFSFLRRLKLLPCLHSAGIITGFFFPATGEVRRESGAAIVRSACLSISFCPRSCRKKSWSEFSERSSLTSRHWRRISGSWSESMRISRLSAWAQEARSAVH